MFAGIYCNRGFHLASEKNYSEYISWNNSIIYRKRGVSMGTKSLDLNIISCYAAVMGVCFGEKIWPGLWYERTEYTKINRFKRLQRTFCYSFVFGVFGLLMIYFWLRKMVSRFERDSFFYSFHYQFFLQGIYEILGSKFGLFYCIRSTVANFSMICTAHVRQVCRTVLEDD